MMIVPEADTAQQLIFPGELVRVQSKGGGGGRNRVERDSGKIILF